MYASVALEFDNDDVVYRSPFSRFMVEKANAKVDGQAFRFGFVYKGDAVERIFHCGDNVAKSVSRSLSQELLSVFIVDNSLNRGDLNAFLAGFPVIVLLFYL